MAKYVITIARQFGSLGRPIARRMSEMLGIEYYDRDIVDAVAAKTELPRSTVIEVDEKINTGFFRMMFPLGQNNLQVQNQVFQTQREIILNLAEQQNCIIVGRCSDYILENVENHLRIISMLPMKNGSNSTHNKTSKSFDMDSLMSKIVLESTQTCGNIKATAFLIRS